MKRSFTRRRFLAAGAASSGLLLPGCDALGRNPTFRDLVLGSGERLAYRAQRLLGASSLAREYAASDMSPDFRTNGNTRPRSTAYQRHAAQGFRDWRLEVGGLVAAPRPYSLAELRAMPARTQITRHDCVEGWSAIGKWSGVPLGNVLDEVRLRPEARFLVFRCADDFNGTPYYESVDLVDGFHPQTILAYAMNDATLPIGHGAPIRLRVERQLGYKHAKFVMAIEAVASLDDIGGGRGGYWEDVGNYEWYAGI